MFYIVGLGNPGERYDETRHNAGRAAVTGLECAGAKVFTPDTYMNKSGEAVKPFIKSAKQAEKLIVVHDDLDLPFGSFKISFNKSSGGHKGVESIIKAVKTEGFVRVRVGISPTTPSGKMKKPSGEKAVGDFILAPFKKDDSLVFKKVAKKVSEALEMIISEGREKAMGAFNSQ